MSEHGGKCSLIVSMGQQVWVWVQNVPSLSIHSTGHFGADDPGETQVLDPRTGGNLQGRLVLLFHSTEKDVKF